MLRIFRALLCLLAFPAVAAPTVKTIQPQLEAAWTVMVYMNAEDSANRLDAAAIADFKEMAMVDYRKHDVNVLLQLDRGGQPTESPRWPGTARFLLHRHDLPLWDAALWRVAESVDMADGDTLKDFMQWSMTNFPAKHYALVLWCHGSGYRAIPLAAQGPAGKKKKVRVGATPIPSKACAFDGDDELYNAELAAAVHDALESRMPGRKLDLLAFDSCLMGMVETAYAMEPVANVLVASEDLVSGFGFDYGPWLTKLTAAPQSSGMEVGTAIVDSFGAFNDKQPKNTATLATIDLQTARKLGEKISELAALLIQDKALLRTQVADVRRKCDRYAPEEALPYFHIDLRRFARLLSDRDDVSADVQASARDVSDAIDNAVGRRYASPSRQGAYGSYGLAIYFPASKSEYKNDPFADHSYDWPVTLPKCDPARPQQHCDPNAIAFVQEQRWAEFLANYFEEVP